MAARPNEPQARPDVGDTLMVIHDFQARSSDELSLSKGDRVELVERDDEFGDGWFLGKHLANGNTGLFPEGMSMLYSGNSFGLDWMTEQPHSLHSARPKAGLDIGSQSCESAPCCQ
jgi:hypothetical protein